MRTALGTICGAHQKVGVTLAATLLRTVTKQTSTAVVAAASPVAPVHALAIASLTLIAVSQAAAIGTEIFRQIPHMHTVCLTTMASEMATRPTEIAADVETLRSVQHISRASVA